MFLKNCGTAIKIPKRKIFFVKLKSNKVQYQILKDRKNVNFLSNHFIPSAQMCDEEGFRFSVDECKFFSWNQKYDWNEQIRCPYYYHNFFLTKNSWNQLDLNSCSNSVFSVKSSEMFFRYINLPQNFTFMIMFFHEINRFWKNERLKM